MIDEHNILNELYKIDNVLYHSCSLSSFIKIINTDTLGTGDTDVSLTRSLQFAKSYKYSKSATKGNLRVILVLDKTKLQHSYKLSPVSDNYSYAVGSSSLLKSRYVGGALSKAEERSPKIKSIKRYITGLVIQSEIKNEKSYDDMISQIRSKVTTNISYF